MILNIKRVIFCVFFQAATVVGGVDYSRIVHDVEISGLLSKHVLQCLSHRFSDRYNDTQLSVSDSSKSQVDVLADSTMFDAHADKVSFQHAPFDLTALSESPSVIYIANLIDSLPVHHIQVCSDGIFEVLVATHGNANLTHIIGETMDDVIHHEHIYPMGKSLVGELKESYQSVPISNSGISAEMIALIQAYVNSRSLTDGYFNVHPHMIQQIQYCLTSLKSTFIATDFGFSTNQATQIDALLVSYGITTFSAVNFDFLAFVCKEFNGDAQFTKNADGSMQTIVMGQSLPDLTNELATCSFEQYQELGDVTAFIDTTPNVDDVTQKAKQSIQYFLPFFNLCYYLFQQESWDAVIELTEQAMDEYGHMAIPFQCLWANTHLALNEPVRAFNMFKSVLDQSPYIEAARDGISIVDNQLKAKNEI